MKSKSEVKHRAINMAPQPPLRETEAANWDFFLSLPETDRKLLSPTQVKDIQLLRAALRVLRRLLRLRRNALHQAAHPALRRPRDDRQCHRLLVHLRRQPAHHALLHQRRGTRTGLVQLALRRQCRIRPGHAPRGRQAERVRPRTGLASRLPDRRGTGAGHPERRPEDRTGHLRPARAHCRTEGEARRHRYAGSPRPAQRGRCPGQEERLDHRRRWLGLRHRLWRPRSRARQRPQRQHPGARYRGLLQHRRPDVEIDAARRRCQVRRRRQTHAARRTSP